MTATSLSSGPMLGALTSSGSSPVFATVANQGAIVVIRLSQPVAAGSPPALMKSTDGGTTWAAVAMISPGPGFLFRCNSNVDPSTVFSVELLDTTSAQYRIDITLSGGSAFFLAQNGNYFPDVTYLQPHSQFDH